MLRTRISLLVVLLPALAITASAQLTAAETTRSIISIRQHYAAINKRSARLRKVKKELSGFSLEGGELIAYFDGPAIVKIVARHFGESGNTLEEYYYHNGQLIFVFEKESRYNRPFSGRVMTAMENRFYFHEDDLIRWIGDKGKEVAVSEEYRLKEKVFLENSNTFVTGARSTKAVIESQP